MKYVAWIIGLLLFTQVASAATIFGTVYDLSLEQAKNIEVSISTAPEQKVIAVNGRYSFNVAPGTYVLTAKQRQNEQITGQVTEEVVVVQDGAFVHDLILEPYFNQDELTTGIDTLDVESLQITADKKTNYTLILILIGLVIVVGFLVYRVNKVMKALHESVKAKIPDALKETTTIEPSSIPDDLQQVITFISEQQGRTTQKEIRTKFPQSEAKISLMIADLEKRGLVKKVKKGRGNVIILNEAKENVQ